jgi:hypothetical protein
MIDKDYNDVSARLAVEGVPVGAIARALAITPAEARELLENAIACGNITEVPPADWPPTSLRGARTSLLTGKTTKPADFLLNCKHMFKLTTLEASFLRVLLLNKRAEKDKLHHVVENLRAQRATRPDSSEETDPKMVDVVICHLRRKLKGIIKITTLWGDGYFIEDAERKALLDRINTIGEPANDNALAEDRHSPADGPGKQDKGGPSVVA